MRTMAYSIVFGPKQLAGAGFIRWTTLQGEGQIMLFLKHWRTYDDVGRLLRVAVAWVQYQSGMDVSILSDVTTPLPYLEARWIPSLRRFLAQINAHITLDRSYIAPLQCVNDEYV